MHGKSTENDLKKIFGYFSFNVNVIFCYNLGKKRIDKGFLKHIILTLEINMVKVNIETFWTVDQDSMLT